jgi:hypothetical protein
VIRLDDVNCDLQAFNLPTAFGWPEWVISVNSIRQMHKPTSYFSFEDFDQRLFDRCHGRFWAHAGDDRVFAYDRILEQAKSLEVAGM